MLDPDRELNLRQFINDITKKAIFRSSHRSLLEIPNVCPETWELSAGVYLTIRIINYF